MKTALVTGANRGIGKALVEALATSGYFVFAGMRHVSKSPFSDQSIMPVALDVQDDAAIKRAAKVAAHKGPLHILINNAGANLDTTPGGKKEHLTVLGELNRQSLLNMFDLNTVSPLIVAKHFVPLMTSDHGFVINISSDRASFENQNTHGNYGYRTSKVALNMATQGLTFDLPQHVSTFAVHPGWVKTDLNPGGVLSPTEAAQKILHILDIWRPSMNGAFLNNDGTVFPR
jgi:NAD(P)-dependent dehydrogenase (short-subunit alcohol dehydrogenase family)